MARVALEIPKVGLVMENARLVRWLKNVGDAVTQGEPLLELETEKSVVEIEATVSGRLLETLIQVDEPASVGDRVAWLESDVAESASSRAPAASESVRPASAASATSASARPAAPVASDGASRASASTPQPAARESSASASDPQTTAPSSSTPAVSARPNGRIKSSPVARRLASQNNIDLSAISGTGPRGRVQLSDIRRAMESASTLLAPGRPAIEGSSLSPMRRALARSMTLSNATIPQFAVERSVDWSSLHAARAKLQFTPKPSVNDFLLQAIARALLSYPALNATFIGNPDSPTAAIVPTNGAHIGLVVAVENGLLVPVLHNVEQLSLTELARRRSDAVDRALKGRLKQSELEGATFSLSNLGSRGPDRFTAIINPPQSAILAVGRQRDCVVAINGGIHIRPMSDLSLTVDHRVADGRLASEFLAYLVEILEGNEWRMT